MKKILLMIVAIATLSGCSMLEEANDSLNYVNEATEYINELSTFAEEATSLNAAELESRLVSLKSEIEEFMALEAPTVAEDLHAELENKSQVLLEEINTAMENGEIAVEQLEQSEIYQTINNITDLMKQVENLGI
ncbi:DUF6376 family protein [Virgibacillus kekensis]|uniref:DUF6376 family protein n=1 Tax=Virgibacillus kekensis TaxID=202261 RepID=A0ABV9DJL1_9BACI